MSHPLTNPGDLTVAEGETAVTTISASDQRRRAGIFEWRRRRCFQYQQRRGADVLERAELL